MRVSGVLAALIVVLLGGCVSLPQSDALRELPPAGLPQRVELTQVPFHAQDDYLCGPASLAMLFDAAGAPASVESLTPQVYLPQREGSLQAEMLGATRRSGLVAYTPPPSMEAVLREIAAGMPVVVLLNLGVGWFPIWHYAVVIGYDLERRKLILRSGRNAREEWNYRLFEYSWRDGGYWSMLALPPGRIPATAQEADFAAAVAALERAGKPGEALASYRALVQRWPASFVGLIGQGNTAYASGNLDEAEMAFRRAAAARPDSAAALNNLAFVLFRKGRLDEAEQAARAAVALGGATLEEARKTLDTILAQKLKRS
ncbi:MAG: PA2778 family cysteine peptidase [Burkholderiales bacterium]